MLDEYDDTFQLGKARLLREGADVLFICSGLMICALEAAKALEADRIGCAVLQCRRSNLWTRR